MVPFSPPTSPFKWPLSNYLEVTHISTRHIPPLFLGNLLHLPQSWWGFCGHYPSSLPLPPFWGAFWLNLTPAHVFHSVSDPGPHYSRKQLQLQPSALFLSMLLVTVASRIRSPQHSKQGPTALAAALAHNHIGSIYQLQSLLELRLPPAQSGGGS